MMHFWLFLTDCWSEWRRNRSNIEKMVRFGTRILHRCRFLWYQLSYGLGCQNQSNFGRCMHANCKWCTNFDTFEFAPHKIGMVLIVTIDYWITLLFHFRISCTLKTTKATIKQRLQTIHSHYVYLWNSRIKIYRQNVFRLNNTQLDSFKSNVFCPFSETKRIALKCTSSRDTPYSNRFSRTSSWKSIAFSETNLNLNFHFKNKILGKRFISQCDY